MWQLLGMRPWDGRGSLEWRNPAAPWHLSDPGTAVWRSFTVLFTARVSGPTGESQAWGVCSNFYYPYEP
eukprot:3285959-Prymnesium_polylepis.1